MIAVIAKYSGPSNYRGARMSAALADMRNSAGGRIGVSIPYDHAKSWEGNADDAVAKLRDKVNPNFKIFGGASLGPAKRVYLMDLPD